MLFPVGSKLSRLSVWQAGRQAGRLAGSMKDSKLVLLAMAFI